LAEGRLFVLHEYLREGDIDTCFLVVRSAESGQRLESYACPYASGSSPLASPCGRWLLVNGSKGLAIWSRNDLTSEPHKLSNDNRKHFTDTAFHPSGRLLAATSNDTTVKCYDTTTWPLVRTYSWNIGRLRSIAFSPDGLLAAAGSDTGQIVVWDLEE